FGGEPLLAENRSTIEYILERAFASGKANFSAITNGTELEAYQDLLAPDKISWLQITLDGVPQEHDKRRIYADGKGSYEQIAQNITRALDLGVQVSVRMNIDRNNVNKLPDLADEIVARG
ncbi:MAG: radical SAM protein, partial [Microcystis sp.]